MRRIVCKSSRLFVSRSTLLDNVMYVVFTAKSTSLFARCGDKFDLVDLVARPQYLKQLSAGIKVGDSLGYVSLGRPPDVILSNLPAGLVALV